MYEVDDAADDDDDNDADGDVGDGRSILYLSLLERIFSAPTLALGSSVCLLPLLHRRAP